MTINEEVLRDLIERAHEAEILKNILAKKLNQYGGIKYEELEFICTMFGIERKVESV